MMVSSLIYLSLFCSLTIASISQDPEGRSIDFHDYVDVNSDQTLVSVDFENEFSELLEDDYSSEVNKDIAKKSADPDTRMSDFERLRQAIRNGWVPLAKPTTKKPKRTKIIKKTKVLTSTPIKKLPPVASIVKNQPTYVATRTPVKSTTPTQVHLVQDTPYAETINYQHLPILHHSTLPPVKKPVVPVHHHSVHPVHQVHHHVRQFRPLTTLRPTVTTVTPFVSSSYGVPIKHHHTTLTPTYAVPIKHHTTVTPTYAVPTKAPSPTYGVPNHHHHHGYVVPHVHPTYTPKPKVPRNYFPAPDIPGLLEDEDATTLIDLLEQADLIGALSSEGPFTIFAPTNEAFAKLDPNLVNALTDDTELLKSVLLYHVVPKSMTSHEFKNDQTLDTLLKTDNQTQKLRMTKNVHNGVITINGAHLIQSLMDQDAKNGLVHFIDEVIYPIPAGTLYQVLKEDDRFRILAEAVQAANLTSNLNSTESSLTIFAPTDDAFDLLPRQAVDELFNDTEALKDLLLNHVIKGTKLSPDLTFNTLESLGREKIHIKIRRGKVFVEEANIVDGDIMATNGAIQVIDKVLL